MTPEEKKLFIRDVASAVSESLPRQELTQEEHTWVKLAIQKEAQTIKYRQAIIEKTLSGLVWMALLGFAYVLKEWAINHGFKP